jgi:hypothetical protein
MPLYKVTISFHAMEITMEAANTDEVVQEVLVMDFSGYVQVHDVIPKEIED